MMLGLYFIAGKGCFWEQSCEKLCDMLLLLETTSKRETMDCISESKEATLLRPHGR